MASRGRGAVESSGSTRALRRERGGGRVPTCLPRGRGFRRSAQLSAHGGVTFERRRARALGPARGAGVALVAGSTQAEWCILAAAQLPGPVLGTARTSFSRNR